jgi:hypothetical protein
MATKNLSLILVRAVTFGPCSVQRLILSMTDPLVQNVSLNDGSAEVYIPEVPLYGPDFPLGYYYIECRCRSDLSRCLFHLMLLRVNANNLPVQWDFNSAYFAIYKYVCCKIVLRSWGLTYPMASA